MACDSGVRKTPQLKTYSRRVKPRIGEPPPKRQRIEEISIVEELLPSAKFARSSIKSYFIPISASASSNSKRPTLPSSDSVDVPSLISSSPPLESPSLTIQGKKSQQRSKRRLTARRPDLRIVNMSTTYPYGRSPKVFVDQTGVGWLPYMVLEHGLRNHFWMYDENGIIVPLISCDMEEAEEEAAEYKRKLQARERKERRKATRFGGEDYWPEFSEEGVLLSNENPESGDDEDDDTDDSNDDEDEDEEIDDDAEHAEIDDDVEEDEYSEEVKGEDVGNDRTRAAQEQGRLLALESMNKVDQGVAHGDRNEQGTPLPKNQPKLKPKSRKFHQTKLDLGQNPIVDCKKCDMTYNKTDAEDRKIHDDYHGRYLWGSGWKGKKTTKRPDIIVSLKVDDNFVEHRIQAIDCRERLEWRDHFEDALEIAQVDLPNPAIEDLELWAEVKNPNLDTLDEKVPRYKVFVYYINRKIVGVLLVERIKAGVLCELDGQQPPVNVTSAALENSEVSANKLGTQECYMSVDRIWVHRECRRQGIATALVDSARKNLIPNMEISKDRMAFSWPTRMGIDFAIAYCGTHFCHELGRSFAFLVNAADVPIESAVPGQWKNLKEGEDGFPEGAYLEFTGTPYNSPETEHEVASK